MVHVNLNVDELVAEARTLTGLERFDAETFREGLGILLADMSKQDIPETAAERMRRDVVTSLANRLRVNDYLDHRPYLRERPIEKPVFVFGVPRTGTTLLNNLLAADPARRSPLAWEIDEPVPPATGTTLKTDTRALRRLEQEWAMLAANPGIGKYYRFSAIYPNECLFFSGAEFTTVNWESRGKLPNYRDYIYSTDLRPTYVWHKLFLQALQADAPGVWNLKQPSHGMYMEAILSVYPDARFVWTHRDPLTALGSYCSLMEMGAKSFMGTADMAWLGENIPWQAVQHTERMMASRDKLGEDRVIDVHYAELTRDPIPTMRRLYAALGDAFTPEAEAAMSVWLADNPQGKFGKHEYKLGAYGLTPDQVRGMFEPYLARYDIEPEG